MAFQELRLKPWICEAKGIELIQNIWKEKGKQLHRQLRRAQIVSKYLKERPGKVLDIGCGKGFITSFISQVSDSSVGVEPNIHSLTVTRKRVKQADFLHATIEYLPFRDHSFDAVCLLEILEHLPEESLSEGIKETNRVLRTGGTLLISVPYKERIQFTQCIHCGKLTPLWGHLRSLDEHKVTELLPSCYRLTKKKHMPNVGILSCLNIFQPLPLELWILINDFLGVIRKGYWIILKYIKIELRP